MKIIYICSNNYLKTNGGAKDLIFLYNYYFSNKDKYDILLIPSGLYTDNDINVFQIPIYQKIILFSFSLIIGILYFYIRIIIKRDNRKFKDLLDNIFNFIYSNTFFIYNVNNQVKKLRINIIHSIGLSIKPNFFNRSFFNNKLIYTELQDILARKEIINDFSKFINKCDMIIFPSKIIEEKFLEFCRLKSIKIQKKIENIPFLIKSENNNATYFNNNKNQIIFGASGRLIYEKGYHLLIKALYEVNKIYPNWELFLAGDGVERNNLEELSSKLNISDKINFLGWLSDTNSFFNSIDIFIHTSFSEGGPMVVQEALSFSKPIISTDVGYVREMVNDNGFVIEINNQKELENKIIYFLENINLIETMSIKSREIYDNYFRNDISLNKMKLIYKELNNNT